MKIAGMELVNVSPRQEELLKAREAFVEKYAKEKGWDLNDLTKVSFQEILEMRKQEGWKNPLQEKKSEQ